MKIGIISMPLFVNYGGIIQNYALQQVMKNMGHTPITLSEKLDLPVWHYNVYKYFIHYCIGWLRWVRAKLKGQTALIPQTKGQMLSTTRKNADLLQQFVCKYISKTEDKAILDSVDVRNLKLDLLIVGSDQVWRPNYVANMLENQFCGFMKDDSIKRISYAASFGVDDWRFSEEETRESRELISRFAAVSVREKSAVRLCKDYWGIDATWVLDPTLLLYKKDYEALCADVPICTEKFVFAYILSSKKEYKEKASKLGASIGCRVIFLDTELTSHKESMEKWLSYFRDADYIITDSFHGTVFSILFEKDFLCFYNPQRGSSRMDSLRDIVKLDESFVESPSIIPSSKIDYVEVERRLSVMRDNSLEFLSNALKD